MMKNYSHIPVMPEETVMNLITDRNGTYVDATLGMAGHSLKLLENLGPEGRIIGIEWDPEMAEIARNNLSGEKRRARVIEGNFADMEELLKREGIEKVHGVLFDLGISSLHFDKPARGFSFSHNARLDMRINPDNPLSAHAIINKWPLEQIEHLIRVTGERNSLKIAKAIVGARKKKPIETTFDLKSLVERIIPYRKGHIHPATRTFLAMRLAVNSELDNLLKGIDDASRILAKNGRICVITFHSLEDKIVKETFKSMENVCKWKVLTRKPVVPQEKEVELNSRARSAKMRVIEKKQEVKYE